MKRHPFKNLLSFLLALVLTVTTVGTLSLITQAKTGASVDAAVPEAAAAQQLSATVAGSNGPALWLCVVGFLGILLVAAVGFLLLRRSRGRIPQGKCSYSPRADRTFSRLN